MLIELEFSIDPDDVKNAVLLIADHRDVAGTQKRRLAAWLQTYPLPSAPSVV